MKGEIKLTALSGSVGFEAIKREDLHTEETTAKPGWG